MQINLNTFYKLLAITFLVVLYTGYQFNIYDQEDHLPQVYKLLSPELYSNDFFVNQYFKSFNVRFFYVSIVYLISQFLGVYITVTLLHFGFLYATVFYTYKLAKKIGNSDVAALVAALLLPTLFNSFNIGLSNLVHSTFIAGSIATPFCLFALYKYFDNQPVIAASAAGLACLFQPLMGIQIFIIIFISSILSYNKFGFKKILYSLLWFIILSSFILIPLLKQQFFTKAIYDEDLALTILTYIRNPHHYVASLFPMMDYIKFIILIVFGLFSANYLSKSVMHRYYQIYFIVIFGMLVYYLGFEMFGIGNIAKTQWFRSSIWLTVLSGISLTVFLISFIENSKVVLLLQKYSSVISIVLILFSGVLIFNSRNIPINKIQGYYYLGNFQKSDLTQMHEWINHNTELNAVFIIPPNDESFLCEAQRSAIVSYKAMIHQNAYLTQWLKKLQSLYSADIEELITGNAKEILSLKYYQSFNNLYLSDAEYIIANKKEMVEEPDNFSLVHTSNSWLLYKKKP